MCAIGGVLATPKTNYSQMQNVFHEMLCRGTTRGRDSAGYTIKAHEKFLSMHSTEKLSFSMMKVAFGQLKWDSAIFNNRAEPTTEYVADKSEEDIQPFVNENFAIAHNGTIANDKALNAKYNITPPTKIDSYSILSVLENECKDFKFEDVEDIGQKIHSNIVGSYALAIVKKQEEGLLLVTNYKPLYIAYNLKNHFWAFASMPEMFGIIGYTSFDTWNIKVIPPYTITRLTSAGIINQVELLDPKRKNALVVCSGGLDSTVAATWAIKEFENVELMHFLYGCRAEENEIDAIQRIAYALKCKYTFRNVNSLFRDIGGSRLTRTTPYDDLARGDEGVEFAYEWVPARNLIMLSIATGYAESRGYDTIILGNNLEESGAYPDNEPEFIRLLNNVMPYAVNANKQVRIEQPVGNLMKHEIVKLGTKLNAPLDKTWSCYEEGKVHCGTCGPCRMRKVAYEINGLKDPITYKE
jgi:7-cyano-7-deazaguanine synthase